MNPRKIHFEEFRSRKECFYIERLEGSSYETKLHIHDCYQIIFCKHGSITHHMTDSSARLLKGDISLVPPGIEHYISVSDEKTVYYAISFCEEILSPRIAETSLDSNLFQKLKDHQNIQPRLCPKYEDIYLMESAIGKMRIEYNKSEPNSDDIISNCLFTVLALTAQLYQTTRKEYTSEEDRKQNRINNCIFYVDTHFDEPIPLEKIVRMSAMSRASFCTLFKEATGLTFSDYLNKKRIERIQTCIRNGASITLTAYGNGYREFSTFHRNFVKYTGMTPSEFKKQCENKQATFYKQKM